MHSDHYVTAFPINLFAKTHIALKFKGYLKFQTFSQSKNKEPCDPQKKKKERKSKNNKRPPTGRYPTEKEPVNLRKTYLKRQVQVPPTI